MRAIPGTAAVILLALSASPAVAGDLYALNQNSVGFSLPGVSLPQSQDEVRAADGTTCRSAVSGSGAYLDLGIVGGNGAAPGAVATYGRVVVPLGRKPPRLDCSRLYALEVERLQMEIKLLKMGTARGAELPEGGSPPWTREGWDVRR